MTSTQAIRGHDPYPSRVASRPEILERVDPVIHGGGPGPLTQEQLESYQQNGFLLVEDLITEQEVEEVFAEVQRLAADPGRRASPTTIIEPRSEGIRSLFAVHEDEGVIRWLAARVAAVARQILGSDVYIHQSRVNLKPGFEGAGFPWHSDFETWHIEDGMPRMRALSCSIALTTNNEFNGPLLLVPGSHRSFVACVGETPDEHYKESLRWQEYGTPDLDVLEGLVAHGGMVSAKGPAGSAVFFDCNTMHGSADNITPFPRSNVFLVYNSVDNHLVEPFGGTVPRPDYIASRNFTPIG